MMWTSRQEAVRRAGELAEAAETARTDATDTWRVAETADEDSRASLTRSVTGAEEAARRYDEVADTYLATFGDRDALEDDDADGWS
jgi:hypothetical protein